MSFLVAGVALVLALVVGAASYKVIPYFVGNAKQDGSEQEVTDAAPAASPSFFSKNRSKLVYLCAMALVCATAAYFVWENGHTVLSLCKQGGVMFILLSAMIIDGNTRRIPNVLILVGLGLGVAFLAAEFLWNRKEFLSALISGGVGSCACLVLFYVLARVAKNGIGLGDIKLIAVIGLILGLATTLFVVTAAMILCAVYAGLSLIRKKKNKNDAVPLGPFLFFGYMILLFLFNI